MDANITQNGKIVALQFHTGSSLQDSEEGI